jgi:hypothetical protein
MEISAVQRLQRHFPVARGALATSKSALKNSKIISLQRGALIAQEVASRAAL